LPIFIWYIIGGIILLLIIAYIFQEKFIFKPEKLKKDFIFKYDVPFREYFFDIEPGVSINGLHFWREKPEGLILYFHGNTKSIKGWSRYAKDFYRYNYDVVLLDYRGFGKSTGKIYSENQMFGDAQRIYNSLKADYSEEKIVVLGYSIGTGLATYLASKNKPGKLVLLAPYFNLPYLMKSNYRIIPTFLLKYRFMTNEHIVNVKAPIAIFHGKSDNVINYQSSEKLYKLCKPNDKLYLISGQIHVGMDDNHEFKQELEKFLQY